MEYNPDAPIRVGDKVVTASGCRVGVVTTCGAPVPWAAFVKFDDCERPFRISRLLRWPDAL